MKKILVFVAIAVSTFGLYKTNQAQTENGDNSGLTPSTLWSQNAYNEVYVMKNVGVKNNNPSYTLDVSGTFRCTGTANFGTKVYLGSSTLGPQLQNASGDLVISSKMNEKVRIGGLFQTKMTVDAATGNVGIGTQNPDALLHLYSTESGSPWNDFRPSLKFQTQLTNASTWNGVYTSEIVPHMNGLSFYTETVNSDRCEIFNLSKSVSKLYSKLEIHAALLKVGAANNDGFTFVMNSNGLKYTGNSGTDVFRVYNDGLTRIDNKLICKEIKVTQNVWADYVFNEDYELRTLEEVENYIETNKHLPDVPSAEEVEENGLNLGNMDATLLRKIEELTLYTIELKKQVDRLDEENEELRGLMSK